MSYDELYKALADEHRREIVSALCREPVVAGELARRVGLAPNALSFHLKWLRSAGLIGMQRRGRHLWYHLNGPALDNWRQHVNTVFCPQTRARLDPPPPRPAALAQASPLPVCEPAPPPAAESRDAGDDYLPPELL